MTIKPIGLAALLATAFTFAFASSSSANDREYRGHAGLLMQVDDDDDQPRRAVRGQYRGYHTDDDDDDQRWHRRHHTQRYAKFCRTVWMHDDWGRSWRQTICR